MKRTRLIALVAAIIAGLALYRFLGVVSQPQAAPTTPVVVAAVDIPENTAVTAEMLEIKKIPTEAVLSDAVLDTKQAVGMVMSSAVYQGEQILSDRLVAVGTENTDSNTLAYVVQPGMRAVTVAVDAQTGLVTMLKPGNRVDVVVNYAVPGAGGIEAVPEARILMQNIEVLALDSTLSRAGITSEEGYSSVTLMVTPDQAVQISYAESNCSLQLILRSPLDRDTASASVTTQQTIQG